MRGRTHESPKRCLKRKNKVGIRGEADAVDQSEDLGFSDFDWIENKILKLGEVSNFYLEECDNDIPKEEVQEEGSLIRLISSPNSEIPTEIPCYRELKKKNKFKKRVGQMTIRLTKLESQKSQEDNVELIGCVNPGLYINVLEEELPILAKEQESRIKHGLGFADNANRVRPKYVSKSRQRAQTEYEEFNIYDDSPLSQSTSQSRVDPGRVKRKKMRASKSQNGLLETNVPVEVMLEEEKNKLKSGVSMGYEDLGIDPFENNDYAFVHDYNTLTKNKHIEFDERPKSKNELTGRAEEV